jgi:hypothetical protein
MAYVSIFSNSFSNPILKPQGLGMLWIFQQISNAICEVLQKSPLKNSNYFTSWTILPLVHLTVQLKFDLLHWAILEKSNYAPWKYISNGVCAYKELAIWINHVVVMASWLRVFSEIHWALFYKPYIGFSSSWTFWKGENRIYNFHVEQFFIWSFLGHLFLRSKTFHFWKLQLPVTCYLGKLSVWLQFLQPWSLKCQMKFI